MRKASDEKCHVLNSEATNGCSFMKTWKEGVCNGSLCSAFSLFGSRKRGLSVDTSTPKTTWLGECGELCLTFPKGWWLLVLGVQCPGPYLMCMFGKCLCAGHHARSSFIQLSQLLSSLIQGDACTSQVPNDSSCGSSHAFDSTRSRDVLGEAARGFSRRGLANCKGEMDRQEWAPGRALVSAAAPWAAGSRLWCHLACRWHMWKTFLCALAQLQCSREPSHSVAEKKLPRGRNHGKAIGDPPLSSQCHLCFLSVISILFNTPFPDGKGRGSPELIAEKKRKKIINKLLTKLLSVKSLSTSSKKSFEKASVLGFWSFHRSKQIPKHVLGKSDNSPCEKVVRWKQF